MKSDIRRDWCLLGRVFSVITAQSLLKQSRKSYSVGHGDDNLHRTTRPVVLLLHSQALSVIPSSCEPPPPSGDATRHRAAMACSQASRPAHHDHDSGSGSDWRCGAMRSLCMHTLNCTPLGTLEFAPTAAIETPSHDNTVQRDSTVPFISIIAAA